MDKEQLQAAFRDASTKASDLNAKLNNMVQDDSASVEDIKKTQDELTDAKTRRDVLNAQLKSFEDVEPEPKKPGKKTNILDNADEKLAASKKAINDFIHHGRVLNDVNGVTSPDAQPIIPDEIIYNPQAEVNSVVDLSTLVTKTPVTTKKGTYPILLRAGAVFADVDELKDNPELEKPQFNEVEWTVKTKRGALAISQESIDDAQVDLTGIVSQQIGEVTVNTYNANIAPVLKGFAAKTSTTTTLVDTIKHILNVDLDPAYVKSIVASQSFYDALDTLKDNDGQYIFHKDITSVSGATLLGVPVYKVGDDLLGKEGDQVAFIGDLKRGVLFTDRKQITLSWEYYQGYGKYLAGVLRFGVEQADAKAGYFLTNTAAPASTTGDGK